MNHSETIVKLAAALVLVQREVEHAHKNATNPHFKNRYADLTEVIDTVRPVLAKHGLSVVQFPGYVDGVTTLESVLLHESGEWISGTAGARMQKDDPQGVGSALTYLRRYSLAAVCGISQDDDDGEAASRPKVVPMEIPRRPAEVPQHVPASAPAQKNARDGFSVDELVGKGEHKALTWRALAGTEKGPGYIRYVLDKWTTLSPAARTALTGLLDAHKASPTEAVLLQDLLNRAADVDAITIDQAAHVEECITEGDSDKMRIAKDWLETQIQRKKLGTPAERWQPA